MNKFPFVPLCLSVLSGFRVTTLVVTCEACVHLGPDHSHHPHLVGFAHGRARGQAEALLEQLLGHLTSDCLALGEDRLQVHGLPQGARFDIFGFQGQANIFAGGADREGERGEGRDRGEEASSKWISPLALLEAYREAGRYALPGRV